MIQPAWITVRYSEDRVQPVADYLSRTGVSTVCESALCPNRWTCYPDREITFMILGEICTRQCGFCGVSKGTPGEVNEHEIEAILAAVRWLKADYAVITSVTRDDLQDGGAGQFARVVRALRDAGTRAELLIPDFNGNTASLEVVLASGPVVIGHNMETVRRLYAPVRPVSDYTTSLAVLETLGQTGGKILTKSGFMLGLGETLPEVKGLMQDIRSTGCDMLTIGQYLRPLPEHEQVKAYVHPRVFSMLEEYGYALGFKAVRSSPLVRSSFKAKEMWQQAGRVIPAGVDAERDSNPEYAQPAEG